MSNHQHHHSTVHTDSAALVEMLDLDGEVLHTFHAELTSWLRELAADQPVHRILDLGSGTGTGTFALLSRFEQADVTAMDVSTEMLERLLAKAAALGVADRVHPVEADLDGGWPAVGTFDLAWASASLHHMADPDRVLTDVLAALRPGGLLAVSEMDSFPRFSGDELEERCHALLAESRAEELPHFGADWGPRLRAAGFAIEAERTFAVHLTPPLPEATGRYAQTSLQRLRSGLDDKLSADEQTALDTLIESVPTRADLTVHAARTVWIARRP
jgi:SAM-dependent methyltransferase